MLQTYNPHPNIIVGILDLTLYHQFIGPCKPTNLQTTEYLTNQILSQNVKIEKDHFGKPFIPNSSIHISISHSKNWLAVIVNELEPTGIDIEMIRSNVLNIQSKFLSNEEILDANNHIEKLLMYWCAKEALYKLHGTKGITFKTQLLIDPFELSIKTNIVGHIKINNTTKSYLLNAEVVNNSYILVYTSMQLKK